MNICFIEDTVKHGGTQLWVIDATRYFISKGECVNIIAPLNSFVANECSKLGAKVYSYDYVGVATGDVSSRNKWIDALRSSDVAIATVFEPRSNVTGEILDTPVTNYFQSCVFAGSLIEENNLDVTLIPKTGTIVEDYLKEYYVPSKKIKSHIITITDYTRNYLIKKFDIDSSDISLVYQGTELSRFISTDVNRHKSVLKYVLPEDAFPIISCVGSFEVRKNQLFLLDVFGRVVKNYPCAYLMIVGDGPDLDKIKKRICDLGLENNVSIFPFTNEPNLIFERCDILALPSLREGLPNVLLECMAMGVPSVSSNIAGIPEIVIPDKTGYLANPLIVDDFYEQMVKIIDKNKLELFSINSKKLIVNNFDKRRQFDRFLELFYKLINKK